jgi:hypothetical protein
VGCKLQQIGAFELKTIQFQQESWSREKYRIAHICKPWSGFDNADDPASWRRPVSPELPEQDTEVRFDFISPGNQANKEVRAWVHQKTYNKFWQPN